LRCNSSSRLVRFSQARASIGEELLRYEAMTGLNDEQLTDLVARLHKLCTVRPRPDGSCAASLAEARWVRTAHLISAYTLT
jgi:hypothetical protein